LGIVALALVACVSACGTRDKRSDDESEPQSGKAQILGVDPESFSCASLLKPEVMASALGGTFQEVESMFEPATGTAAPCQYMRRYGDTTEPWSFDMDCREQALADAKKLFAQYRASGSDAGSSEVDVGKGGLDHHGQSLIFIDDDTPCYVRVHGPDATGRLALAQILSQNLVEANAPMRTIYRME